MLWTDRPCGTNSRHASDGHFHDNVHPIWWGTWLSPAVLLTEA